MHIALVVPGLLAFAPETLARAAPLARLAALASPTACDDLDGAVLQTLGLPNAPAPLAALGAGIDVGRRWVIRADPVTLVVGREDVRLAGRVDDLGASEATTLLALLASHFASDGLAFAAPRADAWFALSERAYAVETTAPEVVLGRTLRPALPTGADAGRWRRWLTETQMLLHDHVFAARAQPVNGVWFSGGGSLPDRARLPSLRAFAAPGHEGDVVRGLARFAESHASAASSLADELRDASGIDALVAALAPVRTSEAFDAALRDFVAPALEALERGTASELTLLADGAGQAARWHLRRPTFLERTLRRRGVFTLPARAS